VVQERLIGEIDKDLTEHTIEDIEQIIKSADQRSVDMWRQAARSPVSVEPDT